MADVSTFSMKTFTSTRTSSSDPSEDSHIDIDGSAGDWALINSATFLSGVTLGLIGDSLFVGVGEEQILVKGNRSVEIQGRLDTQIHGREIRHVNGGRETVIDKLECTSPSPADYLEVRGDRKTLITLNDRKTVIGNDIRNVTGASIKTLHGGELENEVTSWHQNFGELKFEHGRSHGSAQFFNGEANVGKVEVNGGMIGLCVFKNEFDSVHIPLGPLETRIIAMVTRLGETLGWPMCSGHG